MRNWNNMFSMSCVGTSCFQTTYEELKQQFPVHEKVALLSFQTTYEELKPVDFNFDTLSNGASRLPMRNWNLNVPMFLPFMSLLPDYLWGIETCFDTYILHPFSASRLPMRNWNSVGYTNLQYLFFRLPDYLWGIETSRISCLLYQSFRFQTTYEELKSHRKCIISVSTASRPPMRNWKNSTYWNLVFWGALLDYLWGIETYRQIMCRGKSVVDSAWSSGIWSLVLEVFANGVSEVWTVERASSRKA